eukprot:gene1842-24266_t
MNGGGLLLVPYSDSDASNGASDAEDAEDSAAQKRSKRRRVEGTGRFPAVAGNWQTHIRILLPQSDELDDACGVLTQHLTSTQLRMRPVSSTSRHVSLSRTVVLRMHQIDGFVARLRHHVRNTAPFQVEFDGLQQYYNEDRSRGFLGWVCRRGRLEICSLIDRVDAALAEFGLPPFYADRNMHASLTSWMEAKQPLGGKDAKRCGASSSCSFGGGSGAVMAVEEQASALAAIAHSPAVPDDAQVSLLKSTSVAFAKACSDEGVDPVVAVSSIRCSIGKQQYEIQLNG